MENFKYNEEENNRRLEAWYESRRRLPLLDKAAIPQELLDKLDTGHYHQSKPEYERFFYRFAEEELPLLDELQSKYPQAFCCYTD